MSAVLRYEMGSLGAYEIRAADRGLMDEFSGRPVCRWSGNGFVTTWALTVYLPEQAAEAYGLIKLLSRLRDEAGAFHARKSCRTLGGKLCLSLGLPLLGRTDGPGGHFLAAIDEAPGDLGNWAAYGDWLQEREDESDRWRGILIAGWLGSEPLKVKRGIPTLARLGQADA